MSARDDRVLNIHRKVDRVKNEAVFSGHFQDRLGRSAGRVDVELDVEVE